MAVRDFAQILTEYLDEFCDVRPLTKQQKIRAVKRLRDLCADSNVVPIDAEEVDKLVGTFLAFEFLSAKETLILLPDARIWKLLSVDINELHHAQYATYRFLDDLPEIARRAATVRALVVKRAPTPRTLRLCREAYQAYNYGLFTACAATLRSLLERELTEILRVDTGGLAQLIRVGRQKNLYNDDIQRRMKRIKDVADDALHRSKAPSQDEIRMVLADAQLVLDQLGKRAERS